MPYNVLKEAFPSDFDMEAFKKMSFAKKVKYCNEKLKKIGKGSSRTVYMLDTTTVLKLAHNKKGLAQNEAEVDLERYSDAVTQIHDWDKEYYTWLESEMALKITKSKFKQILGYSFEDFYEVLNSECRSYKSCRKPTLPHEILKKIWDSEFYNGVLDLIRSYDVALGDMLRLSSFGMAYRDGKITVVVVDYGATMDVINTHYS